MYSINAVRALVQTYHTGANIFVKGWERTSKVPSLRKITIKEVKLGDDGHNGAVVLVVSTDPPSVVDAICKVYDDAFTPNRTSSWEEAPPTPTEAFEKEKEAYKKLSKKSSLPCGITPEYYGCGKIQVDGEYRPMILLEHVRGKPLHHVNPRAELSAEQRQEIMRKIVEADSDILFGANVRHDDLAPRNIVVETEPVTDGNANANATQKIKSDPRVCLVDFAQSTCFTKNMGTDYKNPLFRWTMCVAPWTDWGWLADSEEEGKQWMWETWGEGGKDGKYPRVVKGVFRGQPEPVLSSEGE
ncbi:hypothetical protein BU26DRAFT_134912 [Trematosphaeria pertusa]|uniref:Non-specific serine/threonine protein kinase n=1 Tax=Trematosphaeria pertusa TaxID=390896 RepID=A0A6A6IUY4_9PLEO|nr:uncharacterized protein BU26DRAFT_134912 [Trematosphaeria pertusa]KAF2254196.1 hypothetical protein BU26DRAFT_134912 [Trematosphaeria pertusa]